MAKYYLFKPKNQSNEIQILNHCHFNRKSHWNIFNIPLVMQLNKRDLEEQGITLIPVETLKKSLNSKLNVPWFETSAANGVNVLETLKTIVSLTSKSISKEIK